VTSGTVPASAVTVTPEVLSFGDAPAATTSIPSGARVVGIAATPDGGGYWVVAADGGVFSFGDARFFGSMGGTVLNRPIVGMAATPSGNGYWLVASDGGVFSFGDARFYGSTGALRLNQPMVGMAAGPGGAGYWLVASDGGIFAFGGAPFLGSTGATRLNGRIVGMAAAPGGGGYRLVASDGGIFCFGAAGFYGSTGALRLNRPVVGMVGTPSGNGYWLVASDGGVFAFGDAGFHGSAAGSLSGLAAAAIVPSASGAGYDILAVPASVRIGFGGDVHGVGRVGAVLASGGNPLSGMAPVLAGDDANIVNLETSVATVGTPMVKQYTFQSPISLLYALKAAGVTVVNLANNHSLDFGAASMLQTIDNAHAAGLLTVGAGADAAQAYAPALVRTPGGTVAFLGLSQILPAGWAATANGPGVASGSDVAASVAAVRAARAEADYVVVMMHWGIEGNPCPTPTQESTAATLLAAGADVVAGSHPHVLQGITSTGSGLVDYSLGDFVWYADNPPGNLTGFLTADLDPGGVTSYQLHPARIDGTGSPQPLGGVDAAAASTYVASLAPGAGTCP